jgi:hypothetical protein
MHMNIQLLGDTLRFSLESLFQGVILFIPLLLIALIIVLLGWLVGSFLGNIIEKLIHKIKLDALLAKAGLDGLMKKTGYKLDSGKFLGGIVQWFVIIAFLMAAFDLLGLNVLNEFLRVIVFYLPNVFVAALILVIGLVLAHVASGVVSASIKAADFASSRMIGAITKWSITVFAFLFALSQLGIAPRLIESLFIGFVAMIALAGGLAFGLGGKDVAGDMLHSLKKNLSRDEQ